MEKCNNDQCQKEKVEMRKQLSEIKEKVEKVEEAIASCRSVIAEKNHEIENLKKKSVQCEILKPEKIFEPFLDVLSREQIDHLNTFQTNSRADSTFVSYVLKCLYAENLDVLVNKSSCGKGNKRDHDASKEKIIK